MPMKSLVRVLVSVFAMMMFMVSTTGHAAKDQCAAAKTKIECGKKAGCAWGKTCIAKPAGKPAGLKSKSPAGMKTSVGKGGKGKGAATTTAKPAVKPAPKKPAAPVEEPEETSPAEGVETEEMGGEEEDF